MLGIITDILIVILGISTFITTPYENMKRSDYSLLILTVLTLLTIAATYVVKFVTRQKKVK